MMIHICFFFPTNCQDCKKSCKTSFLSLRDRKIQVYSVCLLSEVTVVCLFLQLREEPSRFTWPAWMGQEGGWQQTKTSLRLCLYAERSSLQATQVEDSLFSMLLGDWSSNQAGRQKLETSSIDLFSIDLSTIDPVTTDLYRF